MTTIDGFSGTVTDAASPDYDTARATYGVPGLAPALILRPTGTDDVVAAVRYAAAEGLAVCVRSGGHSPYSSADDAVVLDLGDLNGIEVLDGALVRVGSGARWGEVASTLQRHGLALTSGDTTSVGVGGLTLGGGVGWLVRQQGLTIDNLIEAEVVLADGRVITPRRTPSPTCSGRCAAAAATSAWSPPSPSAPAIWTACSPARCSSIRATSRQRSAAGAT